MENRLYERRGEVGETQGDTLWKISRVKVIEERGVEESNGV